MKGKNMSAKKKETEIENTNSAGFDPAKLDVVQNVTLPLLKQEDEKPIYFAVQSKIFQGKEVAQKKGETVMEPADLMRIVDLTDGEEKEIIANSVLKSTLTENYEGESYVGKAFRVIRHAKAQGKRYHTYSIAEIENPLA